MIENSIINTHSRIALDSKKRKMHFQHINYISITYQLLGALFLLISLIWVFYWLISKCLDLGNKFFFTKLVNRWFCPYIEIDYKSTIFIAYFDWKKDYYVRRIRNNIGMIWLQALIFFVLHSIHLIEKPTYLLQRMFFR